MSVGSPCPRCGGGNPLDGDDPVCQCGRLILLEEIDWQQVLHLLVVRSGQRCEARTPDCLGRTVGKSGIGGGYLTDLSRRSVNIHHRRPRGMGGTDRVDVHDLSNLLLLCGSGNVSGCHGFIERNRTVAEARGYLLPKEGPRSHPAIVPVVLPSGRRVLLDELAPAYLDAGGYALGVPDWPVAA